MSVVSNFVSVRDKAEISLHMSFNTYILHEILIMSCVYPFRYDGKSIPVNTTTMYTKSKLL